MAEAQDPSARRELWWLVGGTVSTKSKVPLLGAVVRDEALADRPGRVLDWDGDQTITLEPPSGGGAAWTAQLTRTHRDRAAPDRARWSVELVHRFDAQPMTMTELAAVLQATKRVIDEESRTVFRPRTILTATDVVRDRQRHAGLLPEVRRIDEQARVQIVIAVCTAVYTRPQDDPVRALINWQMELPGNDRGALGQAIETAAMRMAAADAIVRAEAALAPFEVAGPGAADEAEDADARP
jgi:hypothetical protein